MPRCPLKLRGCKIEDETTPICPGNYPKCRFSRSQFSYSQLSQELERWSNTSLSYTVVQFRDDSDLVDMVTQLKSDISLLFSEERSDTD